MSTLSAIMLFIVLPILSGLLFMLLVFKEPDQDK